MTQTRSSEPLKGATYRENDGETHFIKKTRDFFQFGRVFRVWCPTNDVLHTKTWVVVILRLDSASCLQLECLKPEQLEDLEEKFMLVSSSDNPNPGQHVIQPLILDLKEPQCLSSNVAINCQRAYDIVFPLTVQDCGMLKPEARKKLSQHHEEKYFQN